MSPRDAQFKCKEIVLLKAYRGGGGSTAFHASMARNKQCDLLGPGCGLAGDSRMALMGA